MKVVLAGAGAFGLKHLDAIKRDRRRRGRLGGRPASSDATQEVARKYGVPHADDGLAEALAQPGRRRRDPVHADADARRAGASQCMRAGKHVQVEIPLAD